MKDFSFYTQGRTGGFLLPGATDHYAPDLLLEPIHVDLTLHITIAQERLIGTAVHTVRANVDGAQTLTMHAVAFENLRVTGADATYNDEELKLRWSKPFSRGETREVTIDYSVVRPATGLYFSKPSAAYPYAATYAASDSETERARHWFPTVDLPTVRPTLKITLTTDKNLTALANGRLTSETVDRREKTTVWELDQPCPSYLTCIAVGDFVKCDDGTYGERPLAYFAPAPHTEENLRRSFGGTREMMKWLEGRLGVAFPYPKYYQFALPGFGGAMENISLVSWNEVFVANEESFAEWGEFIEQVNLHEMSHSYFGDMVVCRDFASAWLKESWATFMEQVWWEETAGSSRGAFEFLLNARAYFREADERYVRPIMTREYNTSWQMYDMHLYPGGACRLHTLRDELGAKVFWEAVTDYLTTYRDKVVETDHFRHKMEEHSGRSLGKFFDQWFHKKGYPKLKVSFTHDAKAKVGKFMVEQTQVDEKKEIGLFDLNVDLAWVLVDGAHMQGVHIHKRRHEFTVPMASPPVTVRFDPGLRALYKLEFNPGDMLLRTQLGAAPDILGRILAGETLIDGGKRANIEVVGAAYADEPYWGVRQMWGIALAKKANAAALEALAEAVSVESDPRVLLPLLRAMEGVRDLQVSEAVTAKIAAGQLGPRTLAAAYKFLGGQRLKAPLELLTEAAEEDGFLGFAQAGAFEALGMTGSVAVRDRLITASGYGVVPNAVRVGIVNGLGALAPRLAEHERLPIQECLEDLLRDPNARVAKFAGIALVAMRSQGSAAKIAASAADLSVQERHDVEALLVKLRASADPKLAALEEEVEKLRKRVATLEDAPRAETP